MSRQKWNKKFT